MTPYCSRVGPSGSVTDVLIRRPCDENATGQERQRLECHASLERPWSGGHRQKLGRGMEGFYRFQRESEAVGVWLWTSNPQNWETIQFCCFKPPSLWCFVTVALGKLIRYEMNRYLIRIFEVQKSNPQTSSFLRHQQFSIGCDRGSESITGVGRWVTGWEQGPAAAGGRLPLTLGLDA